MLDYGPFHLAGQSLSLLSSEVCVDYGPFYLAGQSLSTGDAIVVVNVETVVEVDGVVLQTLVMIVTPTILLFALL